jgi:diguanylate cyclase (GGDEF)-like protein
MELRLDKKNSRIAVLAIVMFIVFDLAALALNVWLTIKIEQQAVLINLAGRQRMLSQRMVKVLLQLDNQVKQGDDPSERLSELKLTYALFDDTLQGFDLGHETLGGSGDKLFLPAVKGEGARTAVNAAVSLWKPYRQQIQPLFAAGQTITHAVLQPAITIAEASNLQLLNGMNQLTTELELQTQQEAEQIRLYQGSAFVLALSNFFWAFWVYNRRIQAFTRQQNLLDVIINKISVSVLVLDSRERVLIANQTAESLFAYSRGELAGKRLDQLLTGNNGDFTGHRGDGGSFMASCQRSVTQFNQQEMTIVTVLDVTHQRQTEEHLTSLAYLDALTRLPNRLMFTDRLQLEIAYSQRRQLLLAVMFADLDKFKPVNDQCGHAVGDLLLQDVALRLRRSLRETDTVSRHGGDEFTIIVSDIGNVETAAKIAKVVLSQLNQPFTIQNYEFQISCSIGISIYPYDGDEPTLLVKRADAAMYQVKKAGGGGYGFYAKYTLGNEFK